MTMIRSYDKKMNCSACGKLNIFEEHRTLSLTCCDEDDWLCGCSIPEWTLREFSKQTYLNKAINYKKIYQCSNCGYCNYNLENKFKKIDIIYNDKYKKEKNKYIKYFMILKENNFYIKAMKYLFVAYYWKSSKMEKEKIIDSIIKYYDILKKNIKLQRLTLINLIIIDLLRQNKKFDLALEFCKENYPKKCQKIIDFQKKLIEYEDYDGYWIDDIEIIS